MAFNYNYNSGHQLLMRFLGQDRQDNATITVDDQEDEVSSADEYLVGGSDTRSIFPFRARVNGSSEDTIRPSSDERDPRSTNATRHKKVNREPKSSLRVQATKTADLDLPAVVQSQLARLGRELEAHRKENENLRDNLREARIEVASLLDEKSKGTAKKNWKEKVVEGKKALKEKGLAN